MSVMVDKDRIRLIGAARVEDAEPLLAALLEHPALPVDISAFTRAHLAVVQLLHAAGRPLTGSPDGSFLRDVALTCLMQINA
ncbi:hypothetical protein [Sphingobium bisphenolivorans]|uniref:hypothetical protein n=1 Tax=Sphingobium bisphenolivorans TaxID=1335760 RepID=UPI0003AAE671|nr:hypothetical protein [Sphingobium bisphenolivorans]